jgi:PilZ domain-containing protein
MNARFADPKHHPEGLSPRVEPRLDLGREYCQVTYTYEQGGFTYSAEGLVRDFSKKGCGIRGTTIIPPIGSKTNLMVFLPGHIAPLYFEGTVSWTAGEFFGVKFPEMSPKDYQVLRQYMWNVMNGNL